jgi:hypothetical protein
MRTAIFKATFVACLLGAFGAHSFAAESLPASSDTSSKAVCNHAKLESEEKAKANFFPEMRKGAIEVRKVLCVRGGTRDEIVAAFELFVDEQITRNWSDSFGGFKGVTILSPPFTTS